MPGLVCRPGQEVFVGLPRVHESSCCSYIQLLRTDNKVTDSRWLRLDNSTPRQSLPLSFELRVVRGFLRLVNANRRAPLVAEEACLDGQLNVLSKNTDRYIPTYLRLAVCPDAIQIRICRGINSLGHRLQLDRIGVDQGTWRLWRQHLSALPYGDGQCILSRLAAIG
jgi:hypothetical protein